MPPLRAQRRSNFRFTSETVAYLCTTLGTHCAANFPLQTAQVDTGLPTMTWTPRPPSRSNTFTASHLPRSARLAHEPAPRSSDDGDEITTEPLAPASASRMTFSRPLQPARCRPPPLAAKFLASKQRRRRYRSGADASRTLEHGRSQSAIETSPLARNAYPEFGTAPYGRKRCIGRNSVSVIAELICQLMPARAADRADSVVGWP